MSNTETDQVLQKRLDKLEADHAMKMILLRTQLLSRQMRVATQVRAQQHAEAVLQKYLEKLYPPVFPKALDVGMSIVEAGEYLYNHYLYGSDPAQLFGLVEVRCESIAAAPPTWHCCCTVRTGWTMPPSRRLSSSSTSTTRDKPGCSRWCFTRRSCALCPSRMSPPNPAKELSSDVRRIYLS